MSKTVFCGWETGASHSGLTAQRPLLTAGGGHFGQAQTETDSGKCEMCENAERLAAVSLVPASDVCYVGWWVVVVVGLCTAAAQIRRDGKGIA